MFLLIVEVDGRAFDLVVVSFLDFCEVVTRIDETVAGCGKMEETGTAEVER